MSQLLTLTEFCKGSLRLFYKYRALDDWKFLVDIFLNKRLFAAGFESLNDPMEGRYYYGNGTLAQEYRDAVLNTKRQWRICSLSSCCDSSLMWTHYAKSHTGIAIGVEPLRSRSGAEIREVQYVDSLDFQEQADVDRTAKWILSRKLSHWKYESEYRVLTTQSFVPIRIKQVLLGCNVSEQDKELLMRFLKKLHPKVAVQEYESDAMPVR